MVYWVGAGVENLSYPIMKFLYFSGQYKLKNMTFILITRDSSSLARILSSLVYFCSTLDM